MAATSTGCEIGDGAETSELAFETICYDEDQFTAGCRIQLRKDSWAPVFADYAAANEIDRTGAQVRFFPRGENPYEKVAYVFGPHIQTKEFPTPDSEINFIQDRLSPILGEARAEFDKEGVSMLYLGFGNRENSQQPLVHRVAIAKWVLKRFKAIRTQHNRNEEQPADALLMGFSLGGVVGKIALAELENSAIQNGGTAESAHDVGTYISLDAPHMGAYTPLAFQFLPIFIKNALEKFKSKVGGGLNGLFVDFVEIFKDLGLDRLDGSIGLTNDVITMGLKSPLAQDILISNMAYDDFRSPNRDYLVDRSSLPTTTNNIALTSGATNGTGLGLGDTFFTFDTGEGPSDLQFQITASTPTPESTQFFRGRLRYRKSPFQTSDSKYTRTWRIHPNDINLERGSCGWQSVLPRATKEQLENSFRSVWGNFTIDIQEDRNCFIPTYSSMNARGGVNSTRANSNFDVVIPNAVNNPHLTFSPNQISTAKVYINRHFSGLGL